MLQNSYNLHQLLDLSLRTPEVGAVNLNIMYFLLKAMIQVQGIENYVPDICLEEVCTGFDSEEESDSSTEEKDLEAKKISRHIEKLPVEESIKPIEEQKSKAKEKVKKKEKKDEKKKSPQISESLSEVETTEKKTAEQHSECSTLGKEAFSEERVTSEIVSLKRFVNSLEKKLSTVEEAEADIASKLDCVVSEVEALKLQIGKFEDDEDTDFYEPFDSDNEEEKLEADVSLDKETEEENNEQNGQEKGKVKREEKKEDKIKREEKKEDKIKREEKKEDKIKREEKKEDKIKREEKKEGKIKREEKMQDKESTPPTKETKAQSAKAVSKQQEERDQVKKEVSVKKKVPGGSPKLDSIVSEINKIKKRLKMEEKPEKEGKELEKDVPGKAEHPRMDKERLEPSEKDTVLDSGSTRDIWQKIELKIIKITNEQKKLEEKNTTLESTVDKAKEEINGLKGNWDEMVHSTESLKEQVQYVEKEMNVLTEIPGLNKRMEQLEEYVYSDEDYERESKSEQRLRESSRDDIAVPARKKKMPPFEAARSAEGVVTQGQKHTKSMKTGSKDFKLPIESTETEKSFWSIKDTMKQKMKESENKAQSKLRTPALSVMLTQNLGEKEDTFSSDELFSKYEAHYEAEPTSERVSQPLKDEFEEDEPLTPVEGATDFSDFKVKLSAFTTSEVLEEHSRQLKGQVIVFMKKRLEDFRAELQQMEADLIKIKKKNNFLETNLKELFEKLTFAEANYSQRATDFIAVKDLIEKHEASLLTIVQLLDRKAESFVVNQKVEKKELALIEDRVLKMCEITSSGLAKIEEKIDDFIEKVNGKLSEKLSIDQFQIYYDSLRHAHRVLENRIKEASIPNAVLDFKEIRPVEIKKFVITKDGTKVKQKRKKSVTWNPSYSHESLMPATQFQADQEVSPRTAQRIQKQLELASCRGSTRYTEGAYTKIKLGKKG